MHAKSVSAQEVRSLPTARKITQGKLLVVGAQMFPSELFSLSDAALRIDDGER